MTDTLAVLALDCADYELVDRWDCSNLLLDTHAPLETFTFSEDTPLTLEVWPTVATGQHPTEHGIYDDAQTWETPALRMASMFTRPLPTAWRRKLGRPFKERGHELSFDQTDVDHLFEAGAAYGWPGITDADHLRQAWSWMSAAKQNEVTERELSTNVVGNAGKEVGWLLAVGTLGVPIAGVHSHLLDVGGHAYARRESSLREYYEYADDMVGILRESLDRIVVLSDHGIQVSWLDDPEPGEHSTRALVAATDAIEGPLPEGVFDVREWLQPQIQARKGDDALVTMDTARERLETLGYIE